jgi:hypothetical protein
MRTSQTRTSFNRSVSSERASTPATWGTAHLAGVAVFALAYILDPLPYPLISRGYCGRLTSSPLGMLKGKWLMSTCKLLKAGLLFPNPVRKLLLTTGEL